MSMRLAMADALVVLGRYSEAREIIPQSESEQAPALLSFWTRTRTRTRESVVTSEIS